MTTENGERKSKECIASHNAPIDPRVEARDAQQRLYTGVHDMQVDHHKRVHNTECLFSMQMLHLRMSKVTKEQLQQLNIDYPLSEHSRALFNVGLDFEELFNDDDATDDEQTRVDSDLESDGDDGEDSEIGEVAYVPTEDED
ncbi:hypothetical protein HAX54_032074 [Datura stramonium]|uniref:Uncharacterized protein n=1 Tax=Datura stramonium TaxID=4076 RepID=A0ABS8VA70_DATST|nr:hypothetical protein [Datura stramonium]